MNRQVREPFHTLISKASYGYSDSWNQVEPKVLERFAELIVKECLFIVGQSWIEGYVDGHGTGITMNRIEERFGIDE